jgi:hypothetical protein
MITVQQLTLGETLELQINATDIDVNDILDYRDNTDLFEIDHSTGLIVYKPKVTDIGTHEVKIIVSDGNESDSLIFNIEVSTAPQQPLNPYLVVLCPSILVILVILIFIQELLKNRRKDANGDENNKKARDMDSNTTEPRINVESHDNEEIDSENQIRAKRKKQRSK